MLPLVPGISYTRTAAATPPEPAFLSTSCPFSSLQLWDSGIISKSLGA